MTMTMVDLRSRIHAVSVDDASAATAGAGSDGAEVTTNSTTIRPGGERFNAICCLLAVKGVLGATNTLTVAITIQEAKDDGAGSPTDWQDVAADAVKGADSLVLTGGAGGSTERSVMKINIDPRRVRDFVRVQFTPTLSAGATDTSSIQPVWLFGFPQEAPAGTV